ncbi:uncharacterized protein LTHEOB_12462 [Neofusicoccum parvum]|nr:uncharacterized protein LTHEOB_12462 [Neofusicoccum parvum]
MAATRLPEIHNEPSKIQLERLSHVDFAHTNLAEFQKFANSFGLIEAWRGEDTVLYRGYGKDPYCYIARQSTTGASTFGGGSWLAQTQADFDKAAAMDGAVITDLSPFPGGGRRVTLKTPSGFLMHVVYGQEERPDAASVPSAQVEEFGPLNGSLQKQRLGKFQRFHSGPAMIHKLGHYGFHVSKWENEVLWYTENFNFVPSDVQYHPENDELDVITFMHLDLGERFSDHHSLFLARASPEKTDGLHHTSFEVEDFDTQLLGHHWLAKEGYKSFWGVGRHILGSQIFDYWWDTSGFLVEHYADGDLVNVHAGTARSKAGPLHIWGPEMPKDM